MDKEELFDAIDGLFAYDGGEVDSGIHDEVLRAEVIEILKEDLKSDNPVLLSEFLLKYYLSPTLGYTIVDVALFFDWLEEKMDIELRAY